MDRARPDRSLPAPARIWVLLASEASTAVIFRRGPSRWTRLYLWDTRTDEITPGSWFAGRLYEELSDLSPDGRHLLYVARNESNRRLQQAKDSLGTDALYSWTALCRPPWVRALGLWSAGGGQAEGAVFLDDRTIRLRYGQPESSTLIRPEGFTVRPSDEADFPDPSLIALQRTGWQSAEPLPTHTMALKRRPVTLQKRELSLHLSLSDQYRVVREYRWHGPQSAPSLEGVSWADLDQQGRLVYAREGCLYAFVDGRETELADLNADRPPGRPEPGNRADSP